MNPDPRQSTAVSPLITEDPGLRVLLRSCEKPNEPLQILFKDLPKIECRCYADRIDIFLGSSQDLIKRRLRYY